MICLHTWCQVDKLTIYLKKTQHVPVLRIGEVRMQDPITSIGGVPLKDVSSYKYLGINLSSILSFEQAVNGA